MYNWYFDDMVPGMRFESLGKTLSEAEIIDFAFQYDPQPFHIDKAYAEAGVVARLGTCVPVWCKISANGIRGWVSKDQIWGVRPDELRK